MTIDRDRRAVSNFRPETDLAIAAVQRALVTASNGTGKVRFKEGRDVVTDADEAIEDAIRDALQTALGHPVVGEERGGKVIEYQPYWLLDPICGTRNFASGIPLFAVNLALVEDGEITIGVVGDGGSNSTYVAERGRGASTLGGGEDSKLRPSKASRVVDFEAWPAKGAARDRAAAVLARSISIDTWDIRCLSTTLSLAYVAKGQIAATLLFAAPALVHVAAGALLAMEAGAVVTDMEGRSWSMESSSMLAAADANLSQRLLDLLQDPAATTPDA
jgi:myo-inositol-1(or 4)-monophosphatase